MASFAIYLALNGKKFGTLQGYIWSIREHHIREKGVLFDPLDNVADWSRFMSALEVQTWVDSAVEPREMVPFMLLVRALRVLDAGGFEEHGIGTIMLMMYYTMSRSETPVPKRQESFREDQHIRVCDCRLLDNTYVEWGFGAIKQDKRSKRARKDPTKREWKPVGETTGILSMRHWVDRYIAGARRLGHHSSPAHPFFVHEDGTTWVYQQVLDGMRGAMEKCPGMDASRARKYGLHGLRVLGYNCWRAAKGEDVAKLQGGWGSDGHRVYGRDTLDKILSFAKVGTHYAASHALPPMPLDAASSDGAIFRQNGMDRGADARECVTSARAPDDSESSEEEYTISRIIAKKNNRYLVRWRDYDDAHDSWEPYKNLKNTEAMHEFNFLERLKRFNYHYYEA